MNRLAAVFGSVRGLRLRLMLAVVAGAALFSAVVGSVAFRVGHERAFASSRNTLEGLLKAVDKTAAVGAYAADEVLLREIANGLARTDIVARVEVRSARGELLAVSSRADDPRLAAAVTGIAIDHPLASPFDNAERVGMLRIVADDARVARIASDEAFEQAAWMASQAAMVALLLYFVVERLVSRPIVQMARQLQAMRPGTSDRLVTPALHRDDEIGVLIGGANDLLQSNAAALQRERALRAEVEAMEAQYRQIFDSTSAGIFVLDADGHLINGNPTVSRVVGLSQAQMRDLRHDDFIRRVFGRPERVRAMMNESVRSGETVSADLELVQVGDVRRWVHCLISVQADARPADAAESSGSATTVEGVVYDITDRKGAETAARHRSEHDALTGLRNRGAGDAAVDRLLADAMSSGSSVSLLFIDLDGFKQVNDLHGHAAGDQVLVTCAERMRAVVRRSSDIVARLGGDEFLVALRDTWPDDRLLSSTAAALLDALRQPVALDSGDTVTVSACIGIACCPRHGSDRPGLMRAADMAMYHVKRSGKSSYAMAIGGPEVRQEERVQSA